MASLVEIEDDLTQARHFVECAYFACEGAVPAGGGRSALCAVLGEAMEKLEAIGDALGEIRGAADAD